MFKPIALMLVAVVATPAVAQSWTVGPQTPVYPGGASPTYTGVIGDGSTAQGGTPPAAAYAPADIASNFTVSDWITNVDVVRRSSAGAEDKARFLCTPSHENQEDMIKYPGQVHAGHLHTWSGNTLAGKDSTYASLRTTGGSTCPGGPVNRTAYGAPSMRATLPSGATVTVKPDSVAFYYTHDAIESPTKTALLNGMAFIIGVNVDDPDDLARKAEVPAGFTYAGNGFYGYQCTNAIGTVTVQTDEGGTYAPGLRRANGTDYWGGRCLSGYVILLEMHAPECWDGKNLTSVGGRDHLRYAITHNNSGKLVCPTGWYSVPKFEVKERYSHKGWNDYKTWKLSCDVDGRLPGSCGHADWFGAWDSNIFRTAQTNCMGVKIGSTAGNGADCDDGTVSATQRLKSREAAPDPNLANTPIAVNTVRASGPAKDRYFTIKTGTKGPFKLHSH